MLLREGARWIDFAHERHTAAGVDLAEIALDLVHNAKPTIAY